MTEPAAGPVEENDDLEPEEDEDKPTLPTRAYERASAAPGERRVLSKELDHK